MSYLYSPIENAFYKVGIHKEWPSDALEITDSEYDLLVEQRARGALIEYDGTSFNVSMPVPTLAERKVMRARELYSSLTEWNRLYETNKGEIQIDPTGRSNIFGRLATLNADASVDWIMADNSIATFSASEFQAMAAQIGDYISEKAIHHSLLKASIADAADEAALEAITW